MAILFGLSNLGQSMFTFILKSKLITNRQNGVLDMQHQRTTRTISYKYLFKYVSGPLSLTSFTTIYKIFVILFEDFEALELV